MTLRASTWTEAVWETGRCGRGKRVNPSAYNLSCNIVAHQGMTDRREYQMKAWMLAAIVSAGGCAPQAVLPGTSGFRVQVASQPKGDFTPNSHFRVEIEGVDAGQFQLMDVSSETDPKMAQRPGKFKPVRIKLERGTVNDQRVAQWVLEATSGKTERKSGSIIYHDREHNEVVRINFFEAWPVRWDAPELNSQAQERVLAAHGLPVKEWELEVLVSAEGEKNLAAHELAHVVQQGRPNH